MHKKSFKYREAMQELNMILDSLQSEDVDVDGLSSKVKKATELIRICRQKIRNTELEVQNILKKFEGEQEANEKS